MFSVRNAFQIFNYNYYNSEKNQICYLESIGIICDSSQEQEYKQIIIWTLVIICFCYPMILYYCLYTLKGIFFLFFSHYHFF